MSPSWNEYRNQLRNFIQSETSGMLLDADDEYHHRTGENAQRRAGFKLQNGQVVKKFITIWELFDHSDHFNECIKRLTCKAANIHSRVNFTKIITATLTAEELCNHVFDQLRKSTGISELSTYHFGNYPTKPFSNGYSGQFKDEKILILTDIVSSGNLLQNMTESILKQGGQVISVLAVAITRQDWIVYQNDTSQPPSIKFSQGAARIHNLTDYQVIPLTEQDYDTDKLIPIDYASVLPENGSNYHQHYLPIFSKTEMIEHLEKAEAIDFSFYKFDDRRRTCAFIISKLLEVYRDTIWDRIREPILLKSGQRKGKVILVTTYKHKDIIFKDFVEDCLKEEGVQATTGITLKRSVKDIPSRNLTLGARGKTIEGKDVILVLASLSTTERLRNLVSLLVSCEVRKITVICLFNEMGPFTTGFINAIERFTKRVRIVDSSDLNTEESFTDFAFHMIYSFLDIDSDDISKIHKEVDWLFARFKNRTKVPAFDRLSKRIKSYFRSYDYPARTYSSSTYPPLEQRYSIDAYCNLPLTPDLELSSIFVRTQEAKIALITYNLALYRNFDPILEELSQTFDRRTFIHLYGLILSDINYLQFTKVLVKLKNKIFSRLKSLWQDCLDKENESSFFDSQNGSKKLAAKNVGPISYLLFGLGIICHYESRPELERFSIKDLLFCQRSPEEWVNHHSSFLWEYFSDERVPYFTSFLLHSLYPKSTRLSQPQRDSIDDLNSTISHFKQLVSDFSQSDGDEEVDENEEASFFSQSKVQLIQNNLDKILTETGKHEQREKHQTIRYLHREILRPRERHNPIFTNLSKLLGALEEFFDNNFPEDSTDNKYPRFSMPSTILDHLDDALTGTASLSIITESVRQLFYFTPSERDDRERYTNTASQEDSFAGDVDELVVSLNDMRLRKSFSHADYRKIQRLLGKIRDDFYDSKLHGVLREYVVPLDELLAKTLLETNSRLNKEGFQNVLLSEYERWQGVNLGRFLVLCDYYLLQETLRNIFYNLRHSFPTEIRDSLPEDVINISLLETDFTIKPDNQRQRGIFFKLTVQGNAPTEQDLIEPEKTIADQLFKLQEFGTEWQLIPNDSLNSFQIQLTFVSRNGFPH